MKRTMPVISVIEALTAVSFAAGCSGLGSDEKGATTPRSALAPRVFKLIGLVPEKVQDLYLTEK